MERIQFVDLADELGNDSAGFCSAKWRLTRCPVSKSFEHIVNVVSYNDAFNICLIIYSFAQSIDGFCVTSCPGLAYKASRKL